MLRNKYEEVVMDGAVIRATIAAMALMARVTASATMIVRVTMMTMIQMMMMIMATIMHGRLLVTSMSFEVLACANAA